MKPTTQERLTAWTAETRQIKFRYRNWRAVRLLAAPTVALLLAGLPMEYGLGLRQLAHGCWIAGAMIGAAMLVWFFDDRLFIEHPPTSGQ